MKLVDVQCSACGQKHEVLLRSGEAAMPENGCSCGNADPAKFELSFSPPKTPTHSSWSVK